MKNWKNLLLILIMLGAVLSVPVAGQTSQDLEELNASRVLIDALENENGALKERLAMEKATTRLLTELNETRRSETDALRKVLDAKNDTIAAKDTVIAAQDKLIATLQGKKQSPWKRVLDILIGVGVGAVLK